MIPNYIQNSADPTQLDFKLTRPPQKKTIIIPIQSPFLDMYDMF